MTASAKRVIFYAVWSLIIIALAVDALFSITYAASPSPMNAEEATSSEELMDEDGAMEGMEEVLVTAPDEIEYLLPYPGILPDHPLYPLKLMRDRLLDFLIRDPLKRLEFNLLMADKRLNMGIFLTEKAKYELAEETVSKGEKYFVKAIDNLYQVKEQNREVRNELVEKFKTANAKHEEVINQLIERSPENVQNGYADSLRTMTESRDRIDGFSN
ncbi:MAG TPA: DUF5667 domain-containing protein [Patescibacteria group bacterium]|nr:DUF5667 domain-containing protein [Patescibacteria group bacterium]